jgi:hypothetical protein
MLDSRGGRAFGGVMATNYECLYKTNSPEFNRVDKRQSAREDIRRKLETELESSFTGKKTI